MTRTAASGLELLEDHECYQVLGAEGVGTVDVARHALPTRVALAYEVDGRDVLLRTSEQPGLQEALDGAVASLEVDVAQQDKGVSWRVVLVGPAAAEGVVVRLRPTDVTGYRLPTPRNR